MSYASTREELHKLVDAMQEGARKRHSNARAPSDCFECGKHDYVKGEE